jgi:hypothetical protein
MSRIGVKEGRQKTVRRPVPRQRTREKPLIFSYKQSYDKSISDELKERYKPDIETLENEGFSLFSLHQETVWPFSVLIFFPIYLIMKSNDEFVKIESPLKITTYHLIFTLKSHSTYAYVYGMGCKFYTNFTDGTWLVSNTGQRARDKKVIILARDYETITTEKFWERHKSKVIELQENGKQLNPHLSFDTWVGIENLIDRSNLMSIIGMGIVWLGFLGWVIYWLVSKALSLIGVTF